MSKLREIFQKIQSNGGNLFIPIGNLTIELKSWWTSKLDGKFKIEYRIIEFDEQNYHDIENIKNIDFIYDYCKD